MSDQDEKKTVGRPRAEICLVKVEAWAESFVPLTVMADKLGVDVSTLHRRKNSAPEFCAALQRGEATGKMEILNCQMKGVRSGSPQMLKWMGMNYLGQTDRRLIGEDAANPFHGLKEEAEQVIEKILIRLEVEDIETIDEEEQALLEGEVEE